MVVHLAAWLKRLRVLTRGYSRLRRRRESKQPTQVAVIAIRDGRGKAELCLIRRKGSKNWGIPKGFIDPGDTPQQAALTEAYEEAGLEGDIVGEALGTYDYVKRGAEFTVALYLMNVQAVQKRWREMGFRERRWCAPDEAAALLARHPVRPLLRDLFPAPGRDRAKR